MLSKGMAFLLPPELAGGLAYLKAVSQDGTMIEENDSIRPANTITRPSRAVYSALAEYLIYSAKCIHCMKLYSSEISLRALSTMSTRAC